MKSDKITILVELLSLINSKLFHCGISHRFHILYMDFGRFYNLNRLGQILYPNRFGKFLYWNMNFKNILF